MVVTGFWFGSMQNACPNNPFQPWLKESPQRSSNVLFRRKRGSVRPWSSGAGDGGQRGPTQGSKISFFDWLIDWLIHWLIAALLTSFIDCKGTSSTCHTWWLLVGFIFFMSRNKLIFQQFRKKMDDEAARGQDLSPSVFSESNLTQKFKAGPPNLP